MPVRAALRWLDARGWLVLAGCATGREAVRARALTVAAADGPLVVLATGGENEAVGQLLDDFAALGSRSAFLLDAFVEDDATLRQSLAEAGVIVAGAESGVSVARNALQGAINEGMLEAWTQGALVLLEGPAAACAGSWIIEDDGRRHDGLAWLPGALVVAGDTDVSAVASVRALMESEAQAVALGIGRDAALALGPDGELEIWGEQQVNIALGPAWQRT